MSVSGLSLAINAVELTVAQQGLLNYVGTWSQLSLSQARWDPLSTRNLPAAMQEGIATGNVERTGLESLSASGYLRRASGYERALLASLGVDPSAVESFGDGGIPYGDYFSDPLHAWQEAPDFATRVVDQMKGLHDALGRARDGIALWSRSYRRGNEAGTFRLIREELGLSRVVGDPFYSLQGILAQNVGRARWALKGYGMTEEGLLAYFRIPHSRQSGTFPRVFDESDLRAYETIAPPPAA
jgi:hypothetical protein